MKPPRLTEDTVVAVSAIAFIWAIFWACVRFLPVYR